MLILPFYIPQFGGKVVTFNTASKSVRISQVITETELVERSARLEDALATGNFAEYCAQKADQMSTQHGRYVWYFLKANFEANPREHMLNLLGYNADDMAAKFSRFVPKAEEGEEAEGEESVDGADVGRLTKSMAALSRVSMHGRTDEKWGPAGASTQSHTPFTHSLTSRASHTPKSFSSDIEDGHDSTDESTDSSVSVMMFMCL